MNFAPKDFSFQNWFKQRGFEARKYQLKMLSEQIPQFLERNKKPTVLAACPSAGKTITSIAFIDAYLQANPTHRVLVLTHGTTVLRTQYLQKLKEAHAAKPIFDFEAVTGVRQARKSTAPVVVALPHTMDKLGKDTSRFNLVIVDEAHHYYMAPMVRRIIKRSKPGHQLLLTGTPAIFILHDYPIVAVTLSKLLRLGIIEDLLVELASSTHYGFRNEDYNQFGDLKDKTVIQSKGTRATLEQVLEQTEARLRSLAKNYPKIYAGIRNTTGWSMSLRALHKTLVACKSQKQAIQVAQYFRKQGIDVALSTHDTDREIKEVKRFREDPECLVLVVVQRAVLGFDLPELENVIDLTCSHNVNRIFQLLCRVVRKHPQGRKKLFFKVAPASLEGYFQHIVTCALCLTHEDWYLKFNGKNFSDMKIPVNRPRKEKSGGKVTGKKRSEGKITPVWVSDLGSISLMRDILHKSNRPLSPYAYATMQGVREALLLKTVGQGHWTKERCVANALGYNTPGEWYSGQPGAYSTARNNGWLAECCAHMETGRKPDGYWTLERCKEDALKYSTRNQWKNASPTGYTTAQRFGKLDECCAHMYKDPTPGTKRTGNGKRWYACFSHNCRQFHVPGSFETQEEAYAAREKAKKRVAKGLHPTKNEKLKDR